ncbi:MAG: hypothetical protein U9N14_00490 [Pseudomonadota bacterium]|nr:hypothetical protein [Pseudomonadota bacterium]
MKINIGGKDMKDFIKEKIEKVQAAEEAEAADFPVHDGDLESGDYTGPMKVIGNIPDNAKICIAGGDLIVQGNVGDNVTINSDAKVAIEGRAGKNLKINARSFKIRTLEKGANISAHAEVEK